MVEASNNLAEKVTTLVEIMKDSKQHFETFSLSMLDVEYGSREAW